MKSRVEFGSKVLGPILYDFCSRLYLYHNAHAANSVTLFATRSGIRLRYLYELFLKSQGFLQLTPHATFMISRLSAVKSALHDDYEYAVSILLREFVNYSMGDLVRAIISPFKVNLNSSLMDMPINRYEFDKIYWGNNEVGILLRSNLCEQKKLLFKHISECVSGRHSIILVDTGWTGNTQAILMRAFPQWEWYGAYFGRWDYRGEHPWHFNSICGLSIDGETTKCDSYKRAVFSLHHIIEDPLEPPIGSVQYYVGGDERVVSNVRNIDPDMISADDEHYQGILNYFSSVEKMNFSHINVRKKQAFKILSRMILRPKKDDLHVLSPRIRSNDFGRGGGCSCLRESSSSAALGLKISNINSVLWKQGQIRSEFGCLSPLIFAFYNKIRLRALVKFFLKYFSKF